MNYSTMSIDRRAEYYARSAALIAADPLDFYTRAEKGRRFLASRLNRYVDQSRDIVDNALTDMRRKYRDALPEDETIRLRQDR